MIFGGNFVSEIDLVDIALWGFTLFFFGLIFYIRREDRREGYPLETDTTGRLEDSGFFWYPPKKTFILPHNRGTVQAPHPDNRDKRTFNMERMAVWPGAPYRPKGNPLVDGIGPAAWCERDDVADLTVDGRDRIVPFRLGDGFEVSSNDANPVGWDVVAGDGQTVGKVVDLWVDRSEAVIRYLEADVGTEASPRKILIPMPFAVINKSRKRVDVEAIFAEHFKDVPLTKKPDSVTRLEEDKIAGYFGGGKLYASVARQEPLA